MGTIHPACEGEGQILKNDIVFLSCTMRVKVRFFLMGLGTLYSF